MGNLKRVKDMTDEELETEITMHLKRFPIELRDERTQEAFNRLQTLKKSLSNG